ncbi:hypothetical protein BO85DRAFT_492138 [Aspergillus piperis CBS 112811]|uniref:SnoaL-like domain-containing protein n=1 Tax=Aspergillus piperis CBS 112811 TaxID=1448313 RepID=A0A8G1QTI5_9EURO|nr:hypothetical protein BO85DRAFT_492138 [Aspergillus piperis CBS 112811]RAH53312.1 hypothetical protein BO85DRAFT_492138 [Aspergillus piperis CBS 112811]
MVLFNPLAHHLHTTAILAFKPCDITEGKTSLTLRIWWLKKKSKSEGTAIFTNIPELPSDYSPEAAGIALYDPERRQANHSAATFTIPTAANTTFTGRDAIYTMLSDFVSRSAKMEHQIQTVVVDERAGKVATQQRYLSKLVDGIEKDMLTCNFFDVDDQGKIERVVFWFSGQNPL